MSFNLTSFSVVKAQSAPTQNTSSEPVVNKPELYEYSSQLLPGPKEATFNKYFIDTLLPRATRLLISLTAAASVIFIIYGGYRMLFFMGTPENLEAAKNIIVWSIVGLLISLFAYFIVSLVASVNF